MMKRNNGYIEFSFNSSYDELVSKRVISLIDRNKTSFYLEEENMFFKEEDNAYLELVGSKIANYLGIRCVNYDLVEINFTDKNIKGVISKDFREKDKKLVNFDLIINDYIKEYFYKDIDNPMNLEFMCNALNYRYRNYNDVRLIVDNIMDELITYFLLDILIGNYDNGRYNYEIMENESDAKNTPYYDF